MWLIGSVCVLAQMITRRMSVGEGRARTYHICVNIPATLWLARCAIYMLAHSAIYLLLRPIARSAMANVLDSRYLVEGPLNRTLDPSTVTDECWVHVVYFPTPRVRSFYSYGKWLVFGKGASDYDTLWHKIHPMVSSGELGATRAKCSTSLSNGTSADPSRGVVIVYTKKEMRDEVGSKLIRIVERDINYKTNEATGKGLYGSRGDRDFFEKILYWSEEQ